MTQTNEADYKSLVNVIQHGGDDVTWKPRMQRDCMEFSSLGSWQIIQDFVETSTD